MRHIDDGTLRRIQDEPLTITESRRQHLEACVRCRDRAQSIAADMRSAAGLLSAPAPSFEPAAALRRFERHAPERRASPQRARLQSWLQSRRQVRAVAGVAAAAALVGALALTPAGSLAQSFITIFQPQQVAPLYVTADELQSLPNLQQYGTVHAPAKANPTTVADAATASQSTGMHVLVPGSLPAGVPSNATYQVMPGATGTFTFSAAKAQQSAARLGTTLPSMPAGIDGSTLQITTGAAAAAVYGSGGNGNIPALVVGQTVAPTVSSNGASVKEIEDYVLNLPGVSKQLADSIRAIGNPTSTLPIPIPVNLAHADSVTVDGVHGLAIGDSTGLGSAVIWEKDGIIYGVGGQLTKSQVIDIANSLH